MAKKDSNDWLKKWDWHNDASHHVDLQDGVTSYTKNIEVVQYTATGERDEPTCSDTESTDTDGETTTGTNIEATGEPAGDRAVQGQISALSVTLLCFVAMLFMILVIS